MEVTKNKLLDILSNKDVVFYILPYQRNYEWEISECEKLFNDIISVVNKNKDGERYQHFFGSIVYVVKSKALSRTSTYILTDGQQRITTTMLFMAAIRDSGIDSEIASLIDERYLKNERDSTKDSFKVKLKQVESDWEVYKDIILKKPVTKPEDRESAVFRNYTFFKDRLAKKKLTDEEKIDLIEKGLDQLFVVSIQLEPEKNVWENPQEIFESMNSLGKPLSFADLIRNYMLMSKSPEEQDELYKNYWLILEKNLKGEISNFIRDYMQLKFSRDFKKATPANCKELYRQFKQYFEGEDPKELFRELAEYSVPYRNIIGMGISGHQEVDHAISLLNQLKITPSYSFILGLYIEWEHGNISDQEMVGLLKVWQNYYLRRRILQITQGENKAIPAMTKQIPLIVSSYNKITAMETLLGDQDYIMRYPSNEEMRKALKDMNFGSFEHKKVVLELMEETITGKKIDYDNKTISIDHIMPLTLTQQWVDDLGDDAQKVHEEYYNNIGNIVLIKRDADLKNKVFSDKKRIYAGIDGYEVTRMFVIDQSEWTKEAIQKRRDGVIQFLLNKVIPYPDHISPRLPGSRRQSIPQRDFYRLGLIGKTITFWRDDSIQAMVVSDKELLFEGKKWKISPLTAEIYRRKRMINESGSYNGFEHWAYNGKKLTQITPIMNYRY